MNNIKELDQKYIANTYARFPLELVKGEGSLFWDAEGKEYIDMGSGIAVNTFGACDEGWVEAVEAQLHQLVEILLDNACKYSDPDSRIVVTLEKQNKDAVLSVISRGEPLSTKDCTNIFERFYRVDKGRSRQMGGTGLGLAIVKHIVRSMNGEIEVNSKLGEGTEFLVTLPLAPKDNSDKDTIFDGMS